MPESAPAGLFMGRLTLRQPPSGHRVGTDAVLLAAAAPTRGVASALDLGAGVGAVGLAYAFRNTAARIVLAEIDPAAAAMARLNIAENRLDDRISVEEGDALLLSGPQVDLVLTNPPFLQSGRARVSPARRLAHLMPEGGLDRWIKCAVARLRAGGRLVLIHRTDALPELLAALDRRFGAVEVIPVLPRAGEPATRVLVTGVKGARAPFSLRPPLVLHEAGGTFTPLAVALHRGEASLEWSFEPGAGPEAQ